MEPADALAAADGWGGDRMRPYRSGDVDSCVRVDMVGVDDAATARLGDAVAEWVASRPDGAAASTRLDGHIQLDACDAGTGAPALNSERASLPSIRASLVPLLLDEGVPVELATCISVEFVDDVPFELRTAEALAPNDAELVAKTMSDARETCDETG
jgi:hypothetical protein